MPSSKTVSSDSVSRLQTSSIVLLIIADHLRRRSADLKLVAHFLEARSESLHFLLLLRDSRFKLSVMLAWKSLRCCAMVVACCSTFRCSLRNSLSNMAFTAS